MEDLLLDPFRRLLEDVATPAAVRAAERGGDTSSMWQAIEASGFVDALVPEQDGGAGLSLVDLFPLVVQAGQQLLPVPFAETAVARALLAAQGANAPAGSIVIVPCGDDGRPKSLVAPLAMGASLALVQRGQRLSLVPVTPGLEDADLFRVGQGVGCSAENALVEFDAPAVDLLVVAAALTAASMAGAMARLLELSVEYVNDRHQFGRPLGKFQAIQHQLSVMAEQVVSANVAARIGMSGSGVIVDPWRAAVAKCRTSEAAHQVTAIAHAVHGAIGISEEYDLQLYTRRIKRWQLAFGSESYWARHVGATRLAGTQETSVDFVRERAAAA